MTAPEFTPEQEVEFDRIYAGVVADQGPPPPAPSSPGPSRERADRVENGPSRDPRHGPSSRPLLGPATRSNDRPLLGPEDLRGDALKALDRFGIDAQAHATQVSGRDHRRYGPELAVWKLDAARVAGLIEPVPVDLPELPPTASDAARRMRERFAVLLGLRRLRGDGDDAAPFTRRFAADWCGLAETTAMRAIGELREAGVIRKVGTHPSRHGRSPASLYLPGNEIEP